MSLDNYREKYDDFVRSFDENFGGMLPSRESFRRPHLLSPFKNFPDWNHLVPVSFPKCNLESYDDRYVYSLDLPGMKKDELEIREDNNYVTVSGTRRTKVEENEPNHKYYESSYGKFTRTFQLETDAVGKDLRAELNEGVLRLSVPRVVENRGRRVDVN